MDIHRCRFVNYPPPAINALAFSRPSDTQRGCPHDQRLAVGRANGEIEIWNPEKGLWYQETIFRGGKERNVEGLAWTHDIEGGSENRQGGDGRAGRLRLFSIGGSSTVTEWDLARGVPARHANGNFGTLWCLAAQPPPGIMAKNQPGSSSMLPQYQYLAAGCENGTIVLFSTEDGDLHYWKTISKPPTKKPRVLSITWKDRDTLIAGYSDSHIRVYNVHTKENVRTMSLGKPTKGGGNESLVWAVRCLPHGMILSGDSGGDLKIWDGNNYSLVQRLNHHETDVLDIATNADGSMIITGGADRRTVAYKPVPGEKVGNNRRWGQIMHRRYHEHDVKALASFESQDLSIVVSGGLDTVPVVMPLRAWQKEYHWVLPHLPQSPQLSSAPSNRLFVSWWERQVSIWHLSPQRPLPDDSERPRLHPENHTLLTQMFLQGDEDITSAHISENGRYLAVATVSQVRVFRLRVRKDGLDGRVSIRVRKLVTPAALDRFGARCVAFSPNCHWLCSVRLNNETVLLRIENNVDESTSHHFNKSVVKLNRTNLHTSTAAQDTSLGEYLDTVSKISFSADSRILAVGDLSGRIAIWVLEGLEQGGHSVPNGFVQNGTRSSPDASESSSSGEDSSDNEDTSSYVYGQRWRKNHVGLFLPKLDIPLLAMSFRPTTGAGTLDTANNDIGVHPTRHRPNPHAHDLPTGEDRLVAVTAEHMVVEFHALQGKLSDWSRRNPVSYLPPKFRVLRARAMGCVWDVSENRERLWLYGSSWMFMLDLSQDLPWQKDLDAGAINEQDLLLLQQGVKQKKKRRREELEAEELRGRGSGAGGPVRLSKSYVGVVGQVRKSKSSKQEDSEMMQLDEGPHAVSNGDGEGSTSTTLVRLRRQGEAGVKEQPIMNGTSHHLTNGADSTPAEDSQSSLLGSKSANGPVSFLSLRYRSILGIVPISGPGNAEAGLGSGNDHSTAALASNVEVVVVERPLWEVSLPPRFDVGQDWKT